MRELLIRIGLVFLAFPTEATSRWRVLPSPQACTHVACRFVGHSNLLVLLNSIPPYWEYIRTSFYERIGSPNSDEGIAQLKRQSPLFSADKIAAPLLVVQGENDPRARKAESDCDCSAR